MASNDLGGQIEYAYDTITTILLGVSEISFLHKCFGFCVKSVRTDRRTDSFRNYEGEFKWKFKNLPVQKLSVCWENKAYQMKLTFIRKRKCIHKVTWISNRFFTIEDLKEVLLHTPRKFFRIMKKNFYEISCQSKNNNAIKLCFY